MQRKSRTSYTRETIPVCRIGRHGLIRWPPRRPELTPVDFFWEFIRNIAYFEIITDISYLKRILLAETGTVTLFFTEHRKGIEYRLDV